MTIYAKKSGSWKHIQEVTARGAGGWVTTSEDVRVKHGGVWRYAHNSGTTVYSTSGAHSFVVPEGVHHVLVTACGAGGGGGGGYYDRAGQGGGGGGYTHRAPASVTAGDTISITVGAGGAGDQLDYPSSSTDGYGSNGAATTISGSGISITLNGGNGGSGGYEYPHQGNIQGAGGTVSGIPGSTGQRGAFSQSYGYGGHSLYGPVSNKFGTNNGYHASSCWLGLYGDDTGMSGAGTGGGGRPDCGSDGKGGTGAAGYVEFNYGTWWPGAGTQEYTSGTGTFTVPTDVTQIWVRMCGGGGGGGGGSDYGSGGGGSGGWYEYTNLTVTPGQSLSYSIGSGGSGGGSGTAGGSTTFSTLTCTGGAGGTRDAKGNNGTPAGQEGQPGKLYTGAGGVAGQGGSSPFGSGGLGGIGGGPGSTGPSGGTASGYGTGGGGGCNNANGGGGKGGYIKIEW